jgi:hypothetical protein
VTDSSAIGNVADFAQGQVLLPGFVSKHEDGLYVDLHAIDSRGLMMSLIERVFGVGARFVDLDYELFLNLAFLWGPADIGRQLEGLGQKGKASQLRLARDIVPFPDERRGIYRSIKILGDGGAAEYIFEPVAVEREEPWPEAPDGSGRRKFVERLYPDFDEFIAALWERGVRFGIDAKAVRDAIARDKAERLTIASSRAPTEGKDATIDEQTDLLHRDDTPRLLANGRMDLRHYRNRFPQVRAGTRLFKKIPRVAGVSGWNVQGEELLPAAIHDFDIQTLAGIGTRVVKDVAGECVVASQDGFLDIDAQSGQISVLDKIVSREGVSMRTTGDLSLAGDEYEEHGEVQEKRIVKGHTMTFLADIFGNVLSDGGRVTIRRNISGGTARSPGGRIAVEGYASRSLLEAQRGEVVAGRAEGSTFIADRVRIEHAVNCDIVADEVEIERAEGCAIAARKVVLGKSAARKDEPTVVIMLLPDLAHFDEELNRLAKSHGEIEAELVGHDAAFQALTAPVEMKSYLSIQSKLTAKSLNMSPVQLSQWQALLTRLAPALRELAALNGKIQKARNNLDVTDQEIEALLEARRAAARGISSEVGDVSGDTRVYALRLAFDAPALASLPPKVLHKRLHEVSEGALCLFSGGSGSFAWKPPEEAVPGK